jgi:hypothetical protein
MRRRRRRRRRSRNNNNNVELRFSEGTRDVEKREKRGYIIYVEIEK